MDTVESVILGLVQGLTEFIPISSSGHLVLLQNVLLGASDHLFLEFINIGTLAALLVHYRHQLAEIARGIAKRKDIRLVRNILITALPAGLIGYLLADFIGGASFFGSVVTVIVTLTVVGVVMIVADRIAPKPTIKDGSRLTPPRALAIGLAQTLALIPGVSRSGATILAGRFSGLGNESAANYSFLVSIPLMIGVGAKVFITDAAYLDANLSLLIASNAIAFVSGLIAVKFLLKYLARHGLALFGWYRLALAAIALTVVLLQ